MAAKRSRLLMISYGFFATLTIFYGLVEKQSLFATFIAFHLIACLGIPLFHAYREGTLVNSWKEAWGEIHIRNHEGIVLGVVSGAVLLLGIMVGIYVLLQSDIDPLWMKSTLTHWGLHEKWLTIFVFYNIIINSLLEEILWRGFVLQRLLYNMERKRAILLSSFFYSCYHFILGAILFGVKWGAFATVLVFFVGVFWGWLKIRYQAIYATWVSHLLADAGIMASLVLWVF